MICIIKTYSFEIFYNFLQKHSNFKIRYSTQKALLTL